MVSKALHLHVTGVGSARARIRLLAAAAVLGTLACGQEGAVPGDTDEPAAAVMKAAPGDKGVDILANGEVVPEFRGSGMDFGPTTGAKGLQSIAIGSVVRGELTEEDGTDRPAPVDVWTFELPSAGELTFSVRSSEINPLVRLVRADGETVNELMADEALLYISDLEAGAYGAIILGVPAVMAEYMDFSEDPATGAYEIGIDFRKATDGNHIAFSSMLHVGMGNAARELGAAFDVDLASGSRRSGQLRDGSFFEDFPLELAAGETVTVTMRSVDFDTFLLVVQDEEILASNDDWGGSTDSQVTFTAPAAGTYVFRANSFEPETSGMFSLIVDR
jgi:serine protease Do